MIYMYLMGGSSTTCIIHPHYWQSIHMWMNWGRSMAQFPYQYSFFYPGHYLSHLPQLEPWQMDRSNCCAWRQASTQAETGTGTVCEAAAPTTAAAFIASRLLSHHHSWHTSCSLCRNCCLAYRPSSRSWTQSFHIICLHKRVCNHPWPCAYTKLHGQLMYVHKPYQSMLQQLQRMF